MARTQRNLLLALHKWACGSTDSSGRRKRGQDENFTTEAFACLLDYLIRHDRLAASKLLKFLVGKECDVLGCEEHEIKIWTQSRSDKSQPDIKLVVPSMAIAVEIKVDEKVEIPQLQRHDDALRKQDPERNRKVVLITKTPEHKRLPEWLRFRESLQLRDCCWYEVAEKLVELDHKNEVSCFLKKQFVEFLKMEGMTMDRVEEDLTGKKLLAFINFMTMLKLALLDSGFKNSQIHEHLIDDAGWGGFYFGSGEDWGPNPYWCGIEYARPDRLRFHARGLEGAEFDAALSSKWERDADDKDGSQVCGCTYSLQDAGFFDEPALEQLDKLKNFIGGRLREINNFKSANLTR